MNCVYFGLHEYDVVLLSQLLEEVFGEDCESACLLREQQDRIQEGRLAEFSFEEAELLMDALEQVRDELGTEFVGDVVEYEPQYGAQKELLEFQVYGYIDMRLGELREKL